jgi:dihydroneopterin aldolase
MPQTVSIDLEMAWDISQAAASDELKDALDYKAVSKRVETFVQEKQFKLVEGAAHGIADMVMAEFAVPWVRITMHKPHAVSRSKSVGVIAERGSRG